MYKYIYTYIPTYLHTYIPIQYNTITIAITVTTTIHYNTIKYNTLQYNTMQLQYIHTYTTLHYNTLQYKSMQLQYIHACIHPYTHNHTYMHAYIHQLFWRHPAMGKASFGAAFARNERRHRMDLGSFQDLREARPPAGPKMAPGRDW